MSAYQHICVVWDAAHCKLPGSKHSHTMYVAVHVGHMSHTWGLEDARQNLVLQWSNQHNPTTSVSSVASSAYEYSCAILRKIRSGIGFLIALYLLKQPHLQWSCAICHRIHGQDADKLGCHPLQRLQSLCPQGQCHVWEGHVDTPHAPSLLPSMPDRSWRFDAVHPVHDPPNKCSETPC